MAKPDNVSRFFYYLSVLRTGGLLHHGLVKRGVSLPDRDLPPVQLRQFLDDVAYLKELLPLWEPETTLEAKGEGRYALLRQGSRRLSESEFLPFLSALSRTTNLFPYPVDGWLGQLAKSYSNAALKVLEGRVLYTSTPHPDRLKRDHFHTLVQALVDQTRVDLTYVNREGVERKVDFEPVAFLNHNGIWYLVGDGVFSHRSGQSSQPTQLKLSRLRLCRLSPRPFRHRFPLEETHARLTSTYGSHLILQDDTGPRSVTLRFTGEAVRHVKESWFHEGQIVVDRPDGSCDLTLRVNDLFDALQLAGQWGALARPLDPPEFVERWRARAQELAAWASLSTSPEGTDPE